MARIRGHNTTVSCRCSRRCRRWLPAGVAVLSVVAVMSSAHAGIITHNGSSTAPSHPLGTGAVDVTFVADIFPTPGDGVLAVALAYGENATHSFIYAYEAPEPPVLFIDFFVLNNTAVPWTGYEIELVGADYFGIIGGSPATIGDLARTAAPVVTSIATTDEIFFEAGDGDSITLDGSTIVRDTPSSFLSIAFDETVGPGEKFQLVFFVNDVDAGDSGFIMNQTPTPIPAPGAVILALVGFGAIGPVRRWLS